MIHWVSFIHRASFSAWKSFWSYFAQFAFPLLKHGFFHQASRGLWPWPHPLSSKLIMVMNTGNCLKCQNWSPYKCRTAVSMPACAKKRNGPVSADYVCVYRQLRQPPCARHVMTLPTHLPYPILLLVQNLSSKRIAPTNKIQPKLHEEYIPHMWFKG